MTILWFHGIIVRVCDVKAVALLLRTATAKTALVIVASFGRVCYLVSLFFFSLRLVANDLSQSVQHSAL